LVSDAGGAVQVDPRANLVKLLVIELAAIHVNRRCDVVLHALRGRADTFIAVHSKLSVIRQHAAVTRGSQQRNACE
jgi:hypothetical protein